jgi:hypothetical protein
LTLVILPDDSRTISPNILGSSLRQIRAKPP